jgi:hypothetical protein
MRKSVDSSRIGWRVLGWMRMWQTIPAVALGYIEESSVQVLKQLVSEKFLTIGLELLPASV